MFPDRTPSPGLIEFAKVIEPITIGLGSSSIILTNTRDFADTADLAFTWVLEGDGDRLAAGELPVAPIAPGGSAELPLPALPPGSGEVWLTVHATQATDTAWSPAGHVVAWGQHRVSSAPAAPRPAAGGPVPSEWFDPHTGRLRRLGGLDLAGPRLDLWRATTDNDRGEHGVPLAPAWHLLGLHRLTHRTIDVGADGPDLVVRTRVAPAATDLGLLATYRWSRADEAALRLIVEVTPDGDWTVPLPRLGLLLELPAALGHVEWFGGGPGEAYSDTRQAARIGAHSSTVDDLQTPYVYPQENGNRLDVRRVRLTDGSGSGLLVTGDPTFAFSARRWTSADLEAARHTTDLVARDAVYLNVDVAQNGIGTASCGPGVLPQYVLHAEPTSFSVTFTAL